LIAAVNACIAGLFASPLRGRRPAVSVLGVALTLSAVLGYGEWRLSQVFAAGKPVQIAVIQGGMARQFRENPAYVDANLAHYLQLTKEAAATQPTLVFWPEFAVAFPLQRELPQSQQVFNAVRDLGIDLILGGPYYRFGAKDIYNRNSVFLVRQG